MLSQSQIDAAIEQFKTAQIIATALYAQAKIFGFKDAAVVHKKKLLEYRNYKFILEEYIDSCKDCVNLDTIVCEVENILGKYLINCNG